MNRHFSLADSIADYSSTQPASPQQRMSLQEAQVQATLALAYEQRTANLIAFERAQWDAWRQDELNPEGVELWRRAAEQIDERLGLR